MFSIFENKKGAGNIFRKVFGGVFVFVIIAIGAYGLAVPQTTHAQVEGLFGLDRIILALPNIMLGQLSYISVGLSAALLWLSAEGLEHIIRLSLGGFSELVKSDGVTSTWKVLRDFSNMFFIFILLYVAIATILGLDGVNVKKTIIRVVIVALLINFSFFFTKLAIDASNIVSFGFYNQIIQTKCGDGATGEIDNIGAAFMCHLGITKLLDPSTLSNIAGGGLAGTFALAKMSTFGTAILLILAFILGAAMLMFVARFVALLFLLILSPLAFVSMALPNDKYSSRWTESLINNCLVAPAYMIATWIALRVTATLSEGGYSIIDIIKASSLGEISPELLKEGMNSIIIIVMMIATLLVAKEFGAYGAGAALKMLGKAGKMIQGYAGAHTIGRAAGYLDKKIADNVKYGDSRTGRLIRSGTTGALASYKFGESVSWKDEDKRIKELKTDIENKAQERRDKGVIKTGTLSTATPDQQMEAQVVLARMSNKELEGLGFKTIKENIAQLNPSQLEHILEKSEKINESQREELRKARFGDLAQALKDSVDANKTAAERSTANDTAKEKIKNLSPKELELVSASDLAHPTFVLNLKSSQVEDIMKNNRFSSGQKKQIKDQRIKPFRDALATARTSPPNSPAGAAAMQIMEAALKKMSAKEVAGLEDTELTDPQVIAKLGSNQLKELPESKSDEVREKIGDVIRSIGKSHAAYSYITKGQGRAFFGREKD